MTAAGGFEPRPQPAERRALFDVRRLISDLRARIDALNSVFQTGSGTPEGAVTAPVGTLYLRTDGGAATTLYVKESGTGNTGWVAK